MVAKLVAKMVAVFSYKTSTTPAGVKAGEVTAKRSVTTAQVYGTAYKTADNTEIVVNVTTVQVDPIAAAADQNWDYTANAGTSKAIVAGLGLCPSNARPTVALTIHADLPQAVKQMLGESKGNSDSRQQVQAISRDYAKVHILHGNPKSTPLVAFGQSIAIEVLKGTRPEGMHRFPVADFDAYTKASAVVRQQNEAADF
jgi:hypothetical protein